MTKLKQRIWRWHFYAGLVALPFVFLLAISGGVYVLKPQIDQWRTNQIHSAIPLSPTADPMALSTLVEHALSLQPGSTLVRVILAKSDNDPSVEIETRYNGNQQIIWLNRYTADIIYTQRIDEEFTHLFKKIHGELLMGRNGSYVVELAASWMVVLIISGFYLHWPTNTNLSFAQQCRHVFLPRLTLFRNNIGQRNDRTGRKWWRDLHGLVGAWFGVLIILFIFTGLPWSQLWGDGFATLQKHMNWNGPGQEFRITLQSSSPPIHDGLDLWSIDGRDGDVILKSSTPDLHQQISNAGTLRDTPSINSVPVSIDVMAAKAQQLDLPAPVQIQPPKADNGVWTIRSMVQNRPLRVTQHYDQWTGEPIMRIDFSDYSTVKQAVGYGIAFHEGALFGWANQILALMVVGAIVFLCYSGIKMWWIRKPNNKLGAPPLNTTKLGKWGYVTLGLIVILLPMVTLTLIVLIVTDTLINAVVRIVK